uniref:Uncharacterized protein n=1 Tax=Mucochytrium quahogii TaxID=96639 RepID=A0A7S2S6N1_9STRA|mmetsp:Transcript_25311/g.54588  ORF Transcript_25311/g.54588 Transcript_25311/m.54588 type:complete len:190 (+) Transcript_25311:191-760(+)
MESVDHFPPRESGVGYESSDNGSTSDWETTDSEGTGSSTDWETEVESGSRDQEGGDEDGPSKKRRNKRLVCAYEWPKQCSYCLSCEYQVCGIRVETLIDRRVICYAIGDSPMKQLAFKRGIEFGNVCHDPTTEGAYFLGRACPSCSQAQGEFELCEILDDMDKEWLEKHRVLEAKLPRRLNFPWRSSWF